MHTFSWPSKVNPPGCGPQLLDRKSTRAVRTLLLPLWSVYVVEFHQADGQFEREAETLSSCRDLGIPCVRVEYQMHPRTTQQQVIVGAFPTIVMCQINYRKVGGGVVVVQIGANLHSAPTTTITDRLRTTAITSSSPATILLLLSATSYLAITRIYVYICRGQCRLIIQ